MTFVDKPELATISRKQRVLRLISQCHGVQLWLLERAQSSPPVYKSNS